MRNKNKNRNYEMRIENAFGRYTFGPVPSEPVTDRTLAPGRLVKLEITKKAALLKAELGDKLLSLKITLPKFGGVRISSDNEGFFSPDDTEEIKAEKNGCIIIFPTTDKSKVLINTASEYWAVEIYNPSGDRMLCIDAAALKFGFNEEKLEKIKLTMPLGDEMLFGTGERFSGVEQTYNRHQFWNTDCGYHGRSEHLELWKSYKNIPFLHSSRGYSLFWNSFYPAISDLGYTDESIWSWDFWGPVMDLYIWTGNMRKTIMQYTDLTGKSFLPPKWAFRYMSGGGNGFWYTPVFEEGKAPEKYLSVLKRVLEGYSRLGTPNVAALYGEGWIADNPDAYEMLKPYHTRMLNWNPPDYSIEVMRKNLPGVPDSELPVIHFENDKEAFGKYIDFFNPNIKTLLINKYKKYFELGLRGGMLDFAEMVPENAVYCNGMTGRVMHNFNPYWYGKAYGEAAEELVGDDYLYFCRGGCAGSQKWCANFSGDQAAEFYGLKQQLSSALTLGLCGISAWGGDLAGYENKPEPDVFIRGIQFSAFQPLMRAHGTRTRCPWDFGDKAAEVYKKYYNLRENIVDKLYSSAISAHKTGLPMMQAMVLAYPEQKKLADVDTQYIFCDDMLVAPVFERNAEFKRIYFPEGRWYELQSGSLTEGGIAADVPVSLEEIPVYLRAGTVMPVILAESMRLAEPIASPETAVKALLITPPETERSVCVFTDTENQVNYSVKPTGKNTFSVVCDDGLIPAALLIYGDITDIKSNGAQVKYSSDKQPANMTAVIFDDNRLNNIEISLKD